MDFEQDLAGLDEHNEIKRLKFKELIQTATPEELLENELVIQLVERLRREIRNGMNHFDDCAVFFENMDSYDIDANEEEICNCGAAWEYNQSLEALKKFEVKK